MTRVEMLTVSIGMADFLQVTLEENLALVDDIVVVTTESDKDTQDVCRRYSTRYVMTDDHKRQGPFNKGRLIQRGLDQLGLQDWVLHIDSDIILPRQFKRMLEVAHLDEKHLYGADRRMLVGYGEWERFKKHKRYWDCHSYECYLKPREEYPLGSRWASTIHGWAPCGFFQLAHGSQLIERGMHVRNYNITHGNAARTDMQFGLLFDRNRRTLLPEIQVLHLESHPSAMGSNWAGRTTRPFTPDGKPLFFQGHERAARATS